MPETIGGNDANPKQRKIPKYHNDDQGLQPKRVSFLEKMDVDVGAGIGITAEKDPLTWC